ncbi:MAG: AAA family ATPase [Gallionella sp.]|nr:AAA family ATPase [Gallionella sp.]MDD4958560.1 AAA family ATPase [Gallionella sp.]
MRLTSVHISHYKSLSEVNLDNLPPLTLLVGANGTGKSNLVDALRFLRDMVVDGLDHAMSRRGGILMVREHSPDTPYEMSIKIGFAETFDEEVRSETFEGFYEITIQSLAEGNYLIKQERAEVADTMLIGAIHWDANNPLFEVQRIKRDATGHTTITSINANQGSHAFRVPKEQSFLNQSWGEGIATSLVDFLSQLRFSSIFPNTLREVARPDTDERMKESGANWASVLKALKKTNDGQEAFGRILEMMQVVMPTLQDISVLSVGSYLVPQFHVKNGETIHAFDPVQLSDGTLRIFGILLALYQTPPPPFIALEEPEQTIHPAILVMLAEAFREVSERTQLLITSHSPYLVDHFQPEEIRIVSMQDGKTRVSPIKTSQMESVKENLISLQELMVSEGLLAEGQ